MRCLTEVRKKVSRRGFLGVAHHRSRPSTGQMHYSAWDAEANIDLCDAACILEGIFEAVYRIHVTQAKRGRRGRPGARLLSKVGS
jgi:hypothetical protein